MRACILVNKKYHIPRVEGLPVPWASMDTLLTLVDFLLSEDFA